MKLKNILNDIHFNDIYKEISNRKLKKTILPLQELYCKIKEGYILNIPITAIIDKESVDKVAITKNGETLQQFDSLNINEIASIEIEDIENANKIIAGILSFYTLQGTVFDDTQRQKELDMYKNFSVGLSY